MSSYYSKKEFILRVIWGVICPLFFRLSPRLCYGWRNQILRLMGAKIGKNVRIFPSTVITFPWLLVVGDNVVISWDVRIYNLGMTTIGEKTIISQHAHLCGGTHDFESKGFALQRTGLTIGKRVWIAADAFIGPQVIVGDDSVVAARAVVVKNVDPNTLVGGNPAKVIRSIRGAFSVK
ncbi:MAG: putative colanic acid biosynthesis acetyltransferase [Bacteroidales bacterium]